MLVHFTTVHPRTDTRIRLKQVATLAEQLGEHVCLFVQDGKGDEECEGYRIIDVGRSKGSRIWRMTFGAFRMYRAICRTRPKIAHFHDPELLPWGLLLKFSGVSVVYDAHEDLPAALLSKPYIQPILRRLTAFVARTVEQFIAGRMTAVVVATPSIGVNFDAVGATLVQNYPLLDELKVEGVERAQKSPPHFAYVGGMSEIRGAVEMISAISLLKDDKVRLNIAGSASPNLNAKLESMAGWRRVISHGWADRLTVARILSHSRAGLVLFHPEPNHISAQPNKMFEYMAAGLPVIASDFPLWRSIVNDAGCGLLVDPQDPIAIASAMQWMLDHPCEAIEMGCRGRESIERCYNWESESKHLVALYRRILSEKELGVLS